MSYVYSTDLAQVGRPASGLVQSVLQSAGTIRRIGPWTTMREDLERRCNPGYRLYAPGTRSERCVLDEEYWKRANADASQERLRKSQAMKIACEEAGGVFRSRADNIMRFGNIGIVAQDDTCNTPSGQTLRLCPPGQRWFDANDTDHPRPAGCYQAPADARVPRSARINSPVTPRFANVRSMAKLATLGVVIGAGLAWFLK